MKKTSFIPYEGDENYIFISYAHKDSDIVVPILDRLNNAGYRIWYDDGIAPGSEWPEYIAQHLNGCCVALAFVSPNSIASPNCRREVTYALSKNKTFLGVILQKTEMSPGMEMQLSAQQCILKYNFPDDEAFYRKLISSTVLFPCRRPEPAVGASSSAGAVHAETAPKTAVQKEGEPQPITAEDMAAVQQMGSYTSEAPADAGSAGSGSSAAGWAASGAHTSRNPASQGNGSAGTSAPRPAPTPAKKAASGSGRPASTAGTSAPAGKKKVPLKTILLSVVGCIILLIGGLMIYNNVQQKRREAERAEQERIAAAAIPREVFLGTLLPSSSYSSQQPLMSQTANGTALELNYFPTSMQVDRETSERMTVVFQDKFEENYSFAAGFTVADGVLTLSPPENYDPGDDGASPLTDTLTYSLKVYSGEIALTCENPEQGTTTTRQYKNNGADAGTVQLQGTACSDEDIYEGILSVDMTGSDTDEVQPCQLYFADGGYSVDAVIDTLFPAVSTVYIKMSKEVIPYNGRMQDNERSKSYRIEYVNTWPYGFVIKDGNNYYLYQDPVMDPIAEEEAGS